MRSRRSTKPPKGSAAETKLRARVEAQIKPASKLPKRFRLLVYGRSGVGKTRLVSSAPNVLLIDVNEQGHDSVTKDWDPNVYPVEYWDQINEVFWYLQSGDHPYEAFAIDGITGMQNLCMKFVLGDEASRDASRDPDMPSRQVWGKVGELMKTQIINFRNLPMHGLFTALERKRFTGDEDEGGDDVEISFGPNCSPGIAGPLEAAVGMIGYLYNRQVIIRPKPTERRKKPKPQRVSRTRLMIGPSDRYLTKDRYGLMVPHIDAPNIANILDTVYGKEAE
jgi:AAA domain